MGNVSTYNDYLQSQGWSPVASAAILGNVAGESNFDANAVGDNGSAFGLFQIHPNYHPGYQPGISGMDQLAFVSNELKTKYSSLTNVLNSASSVADATKAFMTGWEKPANLSSLGKRVQSALDIFKTGGGDISTQDSTASGSNGNCGSVDVICKLRAWIGDSHFFQRLAIGLLAIIVLALAIGMLGRKSLVNVGKPA